MYKQIDSFKFWCNKVLPLVYDDSLSYMELLAKVVKYVNDMVENQTGFNEVLEHYGTSLEQLVKDTEELSKELEKIKNGGYVSLYVDSITNWLDSHLADLIARAVKFIQFGLEDGHVVAYIPESFDFVEFDTCMDENDVNYGRLIMEW